MIIFGRLKYAGLGGGGTKGTQAAAAFVLLKQSPRECDFDVITRAKFASEVQNYLYGVCLVFD